MKRLCVAGIACFVLLSALAQPLHAHPPVYAGTSSPGMVYEYEGGTVWEPISPVLGEAVLCLTEFEGKLHAGTASLEYDGYTTIGRVYRYDGDGQWVIVGTDFDRGVMTMAVYNNRLYVGTAWDGGDIYRYEGDLAWIRVVDYWYEWVGSTESTAMWVGDDDYLYLAFDVYHYEREESFCSILRYNGSNVFELAEFEARRIYDFSQQGTTLFAASYGCDEPIFCEHMVSRLYRSSDGRYWSSVLEYYDWHLWAMEQFEGKLYLGYGDGLLAKTDAGGSFASVWRAPNSIRSMAADGHDALYFGTGAGGMIYAFDGVSDPAPVSTVLAGGIQCLYHPRTFPDIRPEHWAFEEIEACAAGGVVDGYPDGRYRPRAPITRDQMTVFIARALAGGEDNIPEPTGEPTFPDVPADYWAYKHIEYAYTAGMVLGHTSGLFEPTVALTRDQMAVFIARALCGGEDRVPHPPCSTEPFPDVPCDFWARPHIQYILLEGVTQGYPEGDYHPRQVCTRAEMAVFMSRAFHLSM